MSEPMKHARSSAKKWGGKWQDYFPIHAKLDSSKKAFPDPRHRALTHHPWFVLEVLVFLFGEVITNSDGKEVSVQSIAELHIMEDFGGEDKGFMPSAEDYLREIPYRPWMDNGRGSLPPSRQALFPQEKGDLPPKSKHSTIDLPSPGGMVLDGG